MEDLSRNWNGEVILAVHHIRPIKARFWSFEVKLLLNRANVREAYFQAISNSSWANFGYLVAAEIQGSVVPELRMLAGLHGIGVIELDVEEPSESTIIIPARDRHEIDWHSANRLADENTDFLEVVKAARKFHQTGDHDLSVWDTRHEFPE